MEIPATIIVNNQAIIVPITITLPEQYQGFTCKVASQLILTCEPDLTQHIPGMDQVYLIRADGTNRYKIGHTTRRPADRINELQTACPHDITLIGVCPGGLKLEQTFHQLFESNRVRGEWFEFSEDHVLYIKNLMASYRSDLEMSQRFILTAGCGAATSEKVSTKLKAAHPPARKRSPLLKPIFLWEDDDKLKKNETADRILAYELTYFDGALFKSAKADLNELYDQIKDFSEPAKVILAECRVYKYNQDFFLKVLSQVDINQQIEQIFKDMKQFKIDRDDQDTIKQNVRQVVTGLKLRIKPSLLSKLPSKN